MNKIKWSDSKTKSKILLSAKWHMLRGNKQPYLSIDIHQVKVNGIAVYGWQEQKQAIKTLNLELYKLVTFHFAGLDGSHGNCGDLGYYLKLVREQIANPITYTSEMKQEKLTNLRQKINDPAFFEFMGKSFGYWLPPYLQEYVKEDGEFFKYKDLDKSLDHWKRQVSNKASRNVALFEKSKEGKALIEFFTTLKEYRDLKKDYKTLPSEKDIWTVDRLSTFLNCDRSVACDLVLGDLDSTYLDDLTKEIKAMNKKDLDILTEKYNITTVNG